jgi:hypothetical protein
MKKKIIFSSLIFVLIILAQRICLSGEKFNASVVGDVITFLSITFGFYITSLAIFMTSQFVADLYKVVDKDDNSSTLLHKLMSNYKFGLMLTLISLMYFIAIDFFVKPDVNSEISFVSIPAYPILAFLILNFVFCFIMLGDLVNVIIQEGKIRTKQ